MRDRLPVRVDLLDEIRVLAAATGRSFDEAFARVLARGFLRRIEAELAPLLDDPLNAERPGLTTRASSDALTNATSVASDSTGCGLDNGDVSGGVA